MSDFSVTKDYTGSFFRTLALGIVALTFSFILNNYLNFWQDWPSLPVLYAEMGWFGFQQLQVPLTASERTLGWIQFFVYFLPIIFIILFVYFTPQKRIEYEAKLLSRINVYLIRSFFWAVLLIGIFDMLLSFLRVESFLEYFVGKSLAVELGRSNFRGVNVHYPLIILSFVIGYFSRSLGFYWLSALIVFAEIQIVIARFVFSYEQAFMADLVRFWYGALFLFASPYTLIKEGHVRVDLFYAGYSARGKAWCNVLGSFFLGVPFCWVILVQGMWGKSNVINGPLLNFEVTQAGFGMYVKYLLAGFLLVFSLSMLIQFISYFLHNLSILRTIDQPEKNG